MLKRFTITSVAAVSLVFVAVSSAQIVPDFKKPETIDPTIFDGWVPPVMTGAPQNKQCGWAKKNDYCAEYRYGWAERYLTNFVLSEPVAVNASDRVEITEGKAKSLKRNDGHSQFWFIKESQSLARAHQWKAAMASLNAQVKVWYSSPMLYAMRADIEAALDRDDLAGRDIQAAIYWWENGKWTGTADETPYVIYSSAARWAARNNRPDLVKAWGAKLNSLGSPYNTGPEKLYFAGMAPVEALEVQEQALENQKLASSIGFSPDRLAQIDAALKNEVNSCPSDLSPFNDAVRADYKALDAKKQLLRAAEYCGNIKLATEMRTSTSQLASTKTVWWGAQYGWSCDQAGPGVETAVASGYVLSETAYVLAQFHARCNRPQLAARRYRQLLDAEMKVAPNADGVGVDTSKALADQLAKIGEYAEAVDLYTSVVKYFDRKYGLKDDTTQAHVKTLLQTALDGMKSGKLKLSQEQGAYLEKIGQGMLSAQTAVADDSKKKAICDTLPDNASAVLAAAGNAVRAGQTPAGTVQQWESACNRIRSMLDVATENQCSTNVRNEINRAGNAAYSNGKSYAEAWKKEYLEDLHMGCYSVTVY